MLSSYYCPLTMSGLQNPLGLSLRHALCCLTVAAMLVNLSACGGSSSAGEDTAIRVGVARITKSQIYHRLSVIAGKPASHLTQDLTSEELLAQAIKYLIDQQWVLQEATLEHRPPTQAEIRRKLAEDERSLFPGGQAEAHEFLKQTGQTTTDLTLEAEEQVALAKIQRGITESVPLATDSDIRLYYRQHRLSFGRPEMREIRTTERKSWAGAARLINETHPGSDFAAHSEVVHATGPRGPGGHTPTNPLEAAVDAAKPHVLLGPIKQGVDYFVAEVIRITPPTYPTLAQVRSQIVTRLAQIGHRIALERFVREWRARWPDRTECEPGYVTFKCSGYGGLQPHEDLLTIN